MPDDRLIHGACGHSTKVNLLTDFERLVWALGYKLAADDFGVMRYSAIPLQAKCRWLEKRRGAQIVSALKRIKDVGLIDTFEHQGEVYCFDPAWQTWQKITHPRQTNQPAPALDRVDENTQWLFTIHPRGGRLSSWQPPEEKPEKTGSKSGALPIKTGPVFVGNGCSSGGVRERIAPARAREVDNELAERAGKFVTETYPTLYAKHRKGARYISRPTLDFQEALQLCRVWPDDRLEKLAIVFLTTDHEFAEKGSRTMAQFRSMASWCDSRLTEAGIA